MPLKSHCSLCEYKNNSLQEKHLCVKQGAENFEPNYYA